MSKYFNFGEKVIDISNIEEVIEAYDEGYVFTRKSIGNVVRIRGLRIALANFKLSSENRRILKKFEINLNLEKIPYKKYNYQIQKLGKDFYEMRSGKNTFSAYKIKQLFLNGINFNSIVEFSNKLKDNEMLHGSTISNEVLDGYVIILNLKGKKSIAHYAYPFYKAELIGKNFGMFMMTKFILEMCNLGYDYVYLGSVHSKSSLYKLQFLGAEWFNEVENRWEKDTLGLKNIFISRIKQKD